jgi:serine/threonine protein kinase
MSFALHEVVGNYECLGIISKPRSGLTYKVRNLATGELETLRALPRASSADAESAERLSREIRIHARLTHPNVVGFHDAFELDGQLVMTTDYVDGASLAELSKDGPLPPGEAAGAIVQVLDGLEEAHALGIVHRGITAEHVIVAPDGTVKLGGFDLAKPASDTNLTKVGAVMGDPRYVSPEQVLGRPAPDSRADLYSVGIVLYRALTGSMPFDGESEIDVLTAHVHSEPRPPSALNPMVPAELDRIVLKALRKKPEERYASAAEFRVELTGVPAAEVRPAPRIEAPRPQAARKPAVVWIAAAAIVAAIVLWMALH